MIITGFDEILNVWANDAHKIVCFFNIFFMIFLIRSIITLFQIRNSTIIKNNNIAQYIYNFSFEMLVLLSFILFIIGSIGIFQLVLIPLLDCIVRALGLIIFSLSLIILIINIKIINTEERAIKKEYSRLKEIKLYRFTRNPLELLFLFMSLGLSLTVVSIPSLIISIILFPVAIFRVISKEKDVHKLNDFIEYRNQTPSLFPDYRSFFQKYL